MKITGYEYYYCTFCHRIKEVKKFEGKEITKDDLTCTNCGEQTIPRIIAQEKGLMKDSDCLWDTSNGMELLQELQHNNL